MISQCESLLKKKKNKTFDKRKLLYFSVLRKYAYSNVLKISPPKTEFSDKNSDIFHISAQHIDCGDSLEPP